MDQLSPPALKIKLPTDGGSLEDYRLTGTPLEVHRPSRPFNRSVLSAAHVVADPFSAGEPSGTAALDWDRTMAYRRYLIDQGLGIAEAMDTAQRGMGLDWQGALELIRHTLEETSDRKDAVIFSGCGTEQLDSDDAYSLDDVVRAYLEQLHAIQKLGGKVILMASRALAKIAKGPEDYATVYDRVLKEADHAVILHWLGDMFDPALNGYWGTSSFEPALETTLSIMEANVSKINGIKISLLDDKKEVAMRRRLPSAIKMYTGDDFNYPDLIAGDNHGFSHALLGIFDGIAPAASMALSALAQGDEAMFHRILAPTVPLSRLIFRTPTRYYKTGIVFLAYLNGHQDHVVMINGQQGMRPLPYFCEIFRLADQAGLLGNPKEAVHRMKRFLSFYGI